MCVCFFMCVYMYVYACMSECVNMCNNYFHYTYHYNCIIYWCGMELTFTNTASSTLAHDLYTSTRPRHPVCTFQHTTSTVSEVTG